MRTQESKDRLMDMLQMRLDGSTIQQIADKYGVTKQCVQQQLSIIAGNAKPRPRGIDERVIYPNLAKWIVDNRIAKYKLSEMIDMKSKCTDSIRKKLYGERDFTITEIKKLIEITGYTFEYIFAEKENNQTE